MTSNVTPILPSLPVLGLAVGTLLIIAGVAVFIMRERQRVTDVDGEEFEPGASLNERFIESEGRE